MRERLDRVLVERGLAQTRAKAAAFIMAGLVFVDGRPVTKAGTLIQPGADILLKASEGYVSRGAYKLEAALDAFQVDVEGLTAIDVGASTGGFTDVLLRRKAARVYAVDVGHSQLHWRQRRDPRVVCMEGLNARYISGLHIPEALDLAVFDVSFISLRLVVPPVLELMKRPSSLIALVKPQFEAGRDKVAKGGVIKDEGVCLSVLGDMTLFFESQGLCVRGSIPSPIRGAKGNREYLLYAVWREKDSA
ncbi:MAG TPA: TlyA family RNA methyltransferase [Deltaproteobacteria bacterium]|nr:TlyA family RNA methyltransferase [Deltaproteobacteria bacterium]